MYSSTSLSQPESLKQNDEDDVFGGSFSLSQPNLTYRSPLVSPNQSPIFSSYQSNMLLPMTTAAVVMTKTASNNGNLSPVKENDDSILTSTMLPMDNYKKFNYYVSPSGTPKVLSPVLSNRYIEPYSPTMNYSSEVTDNVRRRRNSGEKRSRKKSVVHALENIIEPNHQNDPLQNVNKKSKYDRKFNEFQLQNGKKCKVIYDGQFSRWIEEDPFSIYSDDVIRFSTKPSSTIEQRNDLSVERIVSQNNNGYWQKNNFIITRNEVILFPNGKWDNRVVEVMSITDDINISVSSILIAKLEWIIEVKTSESNVYTQSNFVFQAFKSHTNNNEKETKSNQDGSTSVSVKKDSTSVKTNKDTKSGEKDNKKSTTSNSSRNIKWILKFYDRESMLYFISLIKYIQTKKVKTLVNEDEEWGSLESDLSSEDTEENGSRPPETEPTYPYETMTSPTSNYLNIPKSKNNEIGHSPPPRLERTSSLTERFYTTAIERKGSLKKSSTGLFSPVLETEDEYADFNGYRKLERQRSYSNTQLPVLEEQQTSKDNHSRKNSEVSASEVNALNDSIRKAELEIMKLQNWRKNKKQSSLTNSNGESSTVPTTTAPLNTKEGEEKDKISSPAFSSPKTNWQSSRDRARRTKMNNWNSNSSSAVFTKIQLSYLDMLENKTKNKVIKLNNNKNTTPEKESVIQVKITDTETANANAKTEEDNNTKTKTENPKLKSYAMQPLPTHRRSSSLTQFIFKDNEFTSNKRNSLSPNSISHPIAIPHSSASPKYSSMSTLETGLSDGSPGIILRKGSVTGMSNNSSFYSPRSSSLFTDDSNILQKNSMGSQKRISGFISPERKTNSILTNITNTTTTTTSDVSILDPKSSRNDLGPFNYGFSLSDNEGRLNRSSIQSNISRNSLESSDHAGHSTTKSTPDISQINAIFRKGSLEGADISMPPLNDDDNSNVLTVVHPVRSSSFHNYPVNTESTNSFPSSEGRPRSGSKTILSSLYRSNSITKSAISNGKKLDTSKDLFKKYAKSSTNTPPDTIENDGNGNGFSSGSEMSKNEAFHHQMSPEIGYHPYMMDLKSSNELYLSSLQQHFQQQQQQQQIQPTIMSNPPILNVPYVTHSLPQSPRISQVQPYYSNNVVNEDVYYKLLNSYGTQNSQTKDAALNPMDNNSNISKPLLLQYKDAQNQLVTVELNDESIIPISFLRNYPKKKNSAKLDPIILNSLQILDILEQTYL